MAVTDNDDFYLTLPSNVDEKDFPRNVPGNFHTTITPPLSINHNQWMVGLAEISYTESYMRLSKRQKIRIVARDGTYDERDVENVSAYEAWIPAQKFKSVDDLCQKIDRAFRGTHVENKLLAEHDKDTKKVKLSFFVSNPRDILPLIPVMEMDGELARVLGFEKEFSMYRGTRIGLPLKRVDQDLGSMYVYSNLATNQHVGNTKVPLLRIVPLTNGDRLQDLTSRTFERIHYVPAASVRGQPVEIKICNDQGTVINFPDGRVIVKLHFKRRKNQ